MPIITPAIMRQAAMRVNTITAPPIKIARVETSPLNQVSYQQKHPSK